jgi:hypothetical protein
MRSFASFLRGEGIKGIHSGHTAEDIAAIQGKPDNLIVRKGICITYVYNNISFCFGEEHLIFISINLCNDALSFDPELIFDDYDLMTLKDKKNLLGYIEKHIGNVFHRSIYENSDAYGFGSALGNNIWFQRVGAEASDQDIATEIIVAGGDG